VVETVFEVEVERVVDRLVELPIELERIVEVEKTVFMEVPVEIERIVELEKIVER